MVGEVVSRLYVRTSDYVPLFCIPIPGKHNPLVVVPIENSLTYFHVQILSQSHSGLEVIGLEDSVLIELLRGFYEFLSSEFEVNYRIKIIVEQGAIHRGFLYVTITNSIIRLLSGKLSREELSLLNLIDSRLRLNDCIAGLRLYEIIKKPYIWRRGDEAIGLSRDIKFYLSTILKLHEVNFMNIIEDPDILNLLTRLSGLLIIQIFRTLDNVELPKLGKYVNLLNGVLWGLFYELHHRDITECVDNYNVISTYITDIDRVMQVCVRMGT